MKREVELNLTDSVLSRINNRRQWILPDREFTDQTASGLMIPT
jgi:hypothetical protein